MRKKLRKRAKHQALLWLMLLALLPVRLSATDFVYDGITYTIIDSKAHTVEVKAGTRGNDGPINLEGAYIPGNNPEGDITIPSTVQYSGQEYTVTGIGRYGFFYVKGLTGLTLPSTIETIGEDAFYMCKGLSHIEMQDGLKTIGWQAFFGCSALTEVVIPESVENLGSSSFSNCTGLISATLPNSIKTVSSSVFEQCTSLVSVNLPDGLENIQPWAFSSTQITFDKLPANLKTIGEYAFQGINITNLSIPESLTEIGDNAFGYCRELAEVSILSSTTKIGTSAFKNCSALKKVVLADGMTKIPAQMFYGCTDLESVNIPSSVTVIERLAFAECAKLTDGINLSDGLVEIAAGAFMNTGLSSITIPPTVNVIYEKAFSTVNLRDVTISDSENVLTLGEEVFGEEIDNLYLGRNLKRSNTTVLFRKVSDITIAGSATEVPEYAFRNAVIKNMNFGNSVTTINSNSFIYCEFQLPLTWPKNLTTVADRAFFVCTLPASIIFPPVISDVGEEALYKCSGLVKLGYPSTIENPYAAGVAVAYNPEGAEIEDGFIYSDNKSAILFAPVDIDAEYTIPSMVSRIGANAYKASKNLTTLTIPRTVITIENNAFSDCRSLNKVILEAGDGKVTFGDGVFANAPVHDFYFGRNYSSVQSLFSQLDTLTIGDDVTAIPDNAFYGMSSLASVSLPNSLTTIGSYAFYNCTGFKSIIIPQNVTSVGSKAFDRCSGLVKSAYPSTIANPFTNGTAIAYDVTGNTVVENGFLLSEDKTVLLFVPYTESGECVVPSTVTTIAAQAYKNCTEITSIEIPANVTMIADGAFDGCSALTSVKIADAATALTLGKDLFTGTAVKDIYLGRNWVGGNLTAFTDITIGSQVTVLPDEAFKGCTLLSGITLPEGLESIGVSAFEGCTALTAIEIPSSVTSISKWAFLNCDKLATAKLSENLTSIERALFSGCSSLAAIEIPAKVESIGVYAFANCATLKEIKIPASVAKIDDMAFQGCTAITDFTLEASDTEISFGKNLFTNLNIENLAIGRDWTGSFGFNSTENNLVNLTFGGNVTSIPSGAFKNCAKLTEVTLSETITSIGYEAFKGCKLATVTFNPSDTPIAIDNTAFDGRYITDLTIGRNWTGSFGFSAYSSDNNLENLVLGENVTSIPAEAFKNCAKLAEVTLPETVSSIGSSAFYGCGLTSIKIPEAVTSIGSSAFYGCGLTSIKIPAAVTSIGYEAFKGCRLATVIFDPSETPINPNGSFDGQYITDLTIGRNWNGSFGFNSSENNLVNLTLGENVTSIPDNAFKNCAKLAEVTLPEAVSSIGESAFYGCSSLVTINIPEAITSIGESTFYGCSSLATINIPEAVTWIGNSAFYGCSSLTSVNIPNAVTSINGSTFYNCSSLASIKIPASVRYIEENAFRGCSGLATVNIESSKEILYLRTNAFSGRYITELIIDRNWTGSFGFSTYSSDNNLKNVTLGENVTSIPEDAFMSCGKLTTLIIPGSVNKIEGGAFYGCNGLTTVVIEPSETTLVLNKSYYYEALSGNTITDLTIGRNWTGSLGFDNNPRYDINNKLANLTLNGNVTSIPDAAFNYCDKLTAVNIPSSVTSIGSSAFKGCSGLKEVEIPNTVKSIGNEAFYDCSGLKEVLIPNSVTSIGSYAFNGCSGLKEVVIPNSVTSVGSSAFNGCSGLVKAAYPDNLSNSPFYYGLVIKYPKSNSEIVDNMVWSADHSVIYYAPIGLTDFNIPANVTQVAENAFAKCSGLANLSSDALTAPAMVESSFDGLYDTCRLTVPDESVNNYLENYEWYRFSNMNCAAGDIATLDNGNFRYRTNPATTPDPTAILLGPAKAMTEATILAKVRLDGTMYTVTAIGRDAFKNTALESVTIRNGSIAEIWEGAFENTKLTEVNIPASVKTIGKSAFANNADLTSVTLGSGVETIGDYAFNKTGLTAITVPDAVTAIGEYAFADNAALTKATLGSGLLTIGDYAFNKTGLTAITVPDAVTAIGEYAFADNAALTKATLGNGLLTIGDYAFANNAALAKATLGNGLLTIGSHAFNKTGLTEITVPDAVTAIGDYAFAGNSALTKATLGNGLLTIGGYAFSNTGITEVEIPGNVTEIGNAAFYRNSALESVVLGNSVKTIGESAFNSTALTSVTIPGSVNSVGYRAFAYNNGLTKVKFAYGEDVINIDNSAFASSPVADLDIDRNFNSSAFSNSSDLRTVAIGNLVSELNAGDFRGSAISSLKIGSSLTAIPDNAFNGCKLTEVIIPSNVTSIGDNAFESNQLTNVIMGCNMETIGENAFAYNDNIATINVTAMTPPAATDNVFSTQNARLNVMPEVTDDYYNADCWYQFESFGLVPISVIKVLKEDMPAARVAGQPQQLKFTVDVLPANASLQHFFWSTSDPEIATVDNDGVVTIHNKVKGTAEITAHTLYDDVVASVTVTSDGWSSADTIGFDKDGSAGVDRPNDVYNMQGMLLKRDATPADIEALTPGFYIIGGKKVLIK